MWVIYDLAAISFMAEKRELDEYHHHEVCFGLSWFKVLHSASFLCAGPRGGSPAEPAAAFMSEVT